MRILVTRPEPDALKLKARLEGLNHEATVEPLLSVDFETSEPIDLTEVQAVIATSRNGLRALKHQRAHAIAAKLPLYAVGPGTSLEARNLGFELIFAGAGGAHGLLPQIFSTLDPQAGFLLHLAGDRLAVDLAGELQLHGFRLLAPVVYRMVPAAALSDDTIEQIVTGEIEAVMLLSPRTADIWVKLVQKHGLSRPVSKLRHITLSPAIASRLRLLAPEKVAIASKPNMEELLALLSVDA